MNCVICLVENIPQSDRVSLIDCNHEFCSECIAEWLKTSPECALCKAKVTLVKRCSDERVVLSVEQLDPAHFDEFSAEVIKWVNWHSDWHEFCCFARGRLAHFKVKEVVREAETKLFILSEEQESELKRLYEAEKKRIKKRMLGYRRISSLYTPN